MLFYKANPFLSSKKPQVAAVFQLQMEAFSPISVISENIQYQNVKQHISIANWGVEVGNDLKIMRLSALLSEKLSKFMGLVPFSVRAVCCRRAQFRFFAAF